MQILAAVPYSKIQPERFKRFRNIKQGVSSTIGLHHREEYKGEEYKEAANLATLESSVRQVGLIHHIYRVKYYC